MQPSPSYKHTPKLSYLFVGIAALLFCLPPLWFYLAQVEHIYIANESAAYRYFFAYRLLFGSVDVIWLPQGQLLSFFQETILRILHLFPYFRDSLRDSINAFSYITLALFCVLTVFIFWKAAADHRLLLFQKLAVYFAGCAPVWSCASAGISYQYSSDYYGLSIVLCPYVVYFFARALVAQGTWRECFWAGLFAGVMAANKISLLILGLTALVPLVSKSLPHVRNVLLGSAAALGGIIIGFFGVFLLLYNGHMGTVVSVLNQWLKFASNPGSEPGFWTNFWEVLSQYNYQYFLPVFLFLLGWAGCTLISQWKKSHRIELTVLGSFCWIFTVVSFALYTVVKRPANTTLFEVNMIIITAIALLIVLLAHIKPPHKMLTFLFVLWAISILLNPAMQHYTPKMEASKESAQKYWEVHEFVAQQHAPKFALMPNNEYGRASIEMAMLKGFSDFPTWEINRGLSDLQKLFPGISFQTTQSHSGMSLEQPYPAKSTVVWFDRADLNPLIKNFPQLRSAVARAGATCKKWVIDDTTANVCVLP